MARESYAEYCTRVYTKKIESLEAKIRVLETENSILKDCLFGSRCQNRELKKELDNFKKVQKEI